MIDLASRKKLLQMKQDRILSDTYAEQQIHQKKGTDLLDSLVKQNEETATLFNKMGQALAMIYRKIPDAVALPRKFQIWGKVEIANTPSVSVENFDEVVTHQKALVLQVKQLTQAISLVGNKQPVPITIPPLRLQDKEEVIAALAQLQERFPDFSQIPQADMSPVVKELVIMQDRIADVQKSIVLLAQKDTTGKTEKPTRFDVAPIVSAIHALEERLQPIPPDNEDMLTALRNINEGIGQLIMRPQMTPQPVTHFSINALNGTLQTSQIQLGSTATPLPAIPLVNRRSWQVFNNGGNAIYFGGSNVTTANGIPVGAGAYSDILDFGANVLIYGVSASGQNNDIRVLEVSDEASGR